MDVVAQWLALKPSFQSVLHAELQTCSPLYFAPLWKERDWAKTKVWFARQPVGVNAINQFMKNMAKEGGLEQAAERLWQ